MAVVEQEFDASADEVFAVLSDGWLYASWVVGAAHIRGVDQRWPAVGSRVHHNVAPWPLRLHDATVVHAVDAPRRLELDAWAWPLGAARVVIEVIETGPRRTRVRMTERVAAGPAKVLPSAVQDVLLHPRNNESLQRLRSLVEGRAAQSTADERSTP